MFRRLKEKIIGNWLNRSRRVTMKRKITQNSSFGSINPDAALEKETYFQAFRRRLNHINVRTMLPHRIWQQIFIILLISVVVPLVVLGILLINTSQNAIKVSILRDNKEIITRGVGEVREFLNGPREALNLTAALFSTLNYNKDSWRQETILVELSLRYPIFRKVAFANTHGQEISVSSIGMPLQDRSSEEGFKSAKAGKEYQSEVYFSDEHMPMMTWYVPIKHLNRIKGVLIAEISLRGVWDIVDSIRIGKSGRAYIIDRQGRLISHPDKKLVLKKDKLLFTSLLEDIFSGEIGSREEVDYRGEQGLVSYAAIEDMNWGLIIFQPEREAYAFLSIMKMQSWFLILFSIVAVIFVSVGLSKMMSRPINKLIEGSHRIANSDFDHPLPVNRNDEMGQLLNSYNKMMEKLKIARRLEKLSTIGQSATVIAHELKNSLILVNTYVQLLPERCHDKTFIKELSQIVPQELNSWKTMLEDMMDYSRLDQFPKIPVNINNVISEIHGSLKEMIKKNDVYFSLNLDNRLPLINGNKTKLRQVLLNLISNAFEVTIRGGSISITTSLQKTLNSKRFNGEGEYVLIKIKDTGSGIKPKNIEKIFEPFFTTKPNGLGLGLAICREIIDRHGGYIEVTSKIGFGTTFSLYLPALNISSNYSMNMHEVVFDKLLKE